MSTLSKQLVALFAVIIFSMAMYGCGGGGSSGPAMTTDDDDGGDDDTAMTCPEGQTGTYPDCMAPGPTAEEIAATTKAAGTKRKAIEAESEQMPANNAGLGGSQSDGTPVDTYDMTIERDRAGTTIKITDSGLAGKDDPKFAQAEDLGGGTTMHSRMMEADDDGDVVEEVVIVTTDIEAPKATAFAKVAGQTLTVSTDTTNDDPTETSEALAVTAGNADVNLPKIMSSAFTATTGATLTFDEDDTGTTNVDEAYEVAGTYNGASGMYRCDGTAACTVTIAEVEDDQLGITGISAGWVFIPDEGATSDVPDSDYLHYGVWLKKTTDEDGVVNYDEVETFADSSVTATDVSDVRGKATYSGGATGVYVHSVVNPDGKEASATSGHFTADAELTAYFGQTVNDSETTVDESGQIAPNLLYTISGTIDNFMLSGHDEGPGWSVSLEKGAPQQTASNEATGVAKGGGSDGSYSATFHGPVGNHDDNPDTPAIPHPTSVVGEFNAFFSNGSVAGAFGARKQQ